MKRAAIVFGAVLAATAGQAAEPSLQGQAKALLAKSPPPDEVFRLKQDMGAERFKSLNGEIFRQAFSLPEGAPSEVTVPAPCVANAAAIRLLALMNLARMTDDEGQWHARWSEGEGALGKWAALRKTEVEQAEQRLRASGAAPESRRTELARRLALDQFVRVTFPGFLPGGAWAEGVSAPVRQYLNSVAVADGCAVDRDNTAWLKADIDRRGWPTISREGKDADHAAFMIVQHAVQDPAWQAQVLVQMGELAKAGETDPKNYAYLFDRVTQRRGGLQRYGSQGHCAGVSEWRPFDNEPGDLDARRASVGLPPEATYIAGMKALCQKADGA